MMLPEIFSKSLMGAMVVTLATASGLSATEPVDYVNPFIGTAEHGHVYPGASVPFGMIQLSPDTRTETWDGCSGYHYSDTNIIGFSHNHLTGTGCRDLGNILLMPTVGGDGIHMSNGVCSGYATYFSHDKEKASPGYYSVYLPEYDIKVELTATTHAGMHRYTFPKRDMIDHNGSHIVIDLSHGIGNKTLDSELKIENNQTISGFRKSRGWGGEKIFYFVVEFSRPFEFYGRAGSSAAAGIFCFTTKAGEQILARVALSTVSVEGAKANLKAEIPNWDFDAVAKAARKQWNDALGTIQIKTDDKDLRQTFYTALYHAFLAPTILNDVNGQYRGPDRKVHKADGYNYYTELSIWDIFRAESPLLTLTQPQRVNDIVKTMMAHYTNFGHNSLPVWPNGGMETWCMIGNHAIPMIVEAYNKGFRDWDAQQALAAMIASVETDRNSQDKYRALGYVPSTTLADNDKRDNKSQGVSKTVENAYDDACIARFARMLGSNDLAQIYAKRSDNWKNVFDPSTGFMRGRTENGEWRTPFNPDKIDFNDYTEANAWHYSFFVPHNMPALIAAMGGDDKFVAKVDEMFDTTNQLPAQWVDVTGLIGMYAHGNEPCHHAAYIYNYAGQPWKTQARIRKVANTLYNNTVGGLCGNDDCGQISAWYVLTAMGFYPVDPASGVYVIGSPFVDKATLQLNSRYYKKGVFTMIAKNNSPKNIYIQSATLNGKPLTRSWITHDEIVNGGTLELVMGPTPNKNWGAAPADRPGHN